MPFDIRYTNTNNETIFKHEYDSIFDSIIETNPFDNPRYKASIYARYRASIYARYIRAIYPRYTRVRMAYEYPR